MLKCIHWKNKIVKITNFSEYIIVQLQGFNNYFILDTYISYTTDTLNY